jgi:hypothetical protein
MELMRQGVAIVVLSLGVTPVIACRDRSSDPARVRVVERVGVAMGSELRLTASTVDEPGARAAFDAVFAEF